MRQRGFFLIDALISLSLLTFGVCAVAAAFSGTRSAMERGEIEASLATCAQEKFLPAAPNGSASSRCVEFFQWKKEEKAVSPMLKSVKWTATWEFQGNRYDESFETIAPIL